MEDETPVCSAKGCRAEARHLLVWNNPRLHTPDREKTWAACDDHRASLSEHLDVRGFLRRVDALRAACPTCGASFPAGAAYCPVCAGVQAGACGSGGDR
jgi:hypothetical protein